MISLTRREFDAVSSKLLEACFDADRQRRPAVAEMRRRLKTTLVDQPVTRLVRRAPAPVH